MFGSQTNSTIDWDESPVNYTCLNQLHRYEPNFKYAAELEEELIPPAYQASLAHCPFFVLNT
jgi:hypothetical protein